MIKIILTVIKWLIFVSAVPLIYVIGELPTHAEAMSGLYAHECKYVTDLVSNS